MSQQTISTLETASKSETTMITFNCCPNNLEPDWAPYDALELGYVADISDEDEEDIFCERVETKEEAHFVSLYAHLKCGGVECIHDFPDGYFELDAIGSASKTLADRLGFGLNTFI